MALKKTVGHRTCTIYRKEAIHMIEQKNIHEMTRREYCGYVQQHYQNDPQWVRKRLISKLDQEHNMKKNADTPQQPGGIK